MKRIAETRNLCKIYGEKNPVHALDNVSMEIYEGEMLVVLGSSGSGKSTLLHMLGGMDAPTSGEIWFRDQEISALRPDARAAFRRSEIGFVFQFYNLIADLTARENVELAAALVKNPLPVSEVLEAVGLGDKAGQYPATLSGGEQQRVSIARALVKPTGLLLCDEPTGALDFESGKMVLKIIEKLVKEKGQTVVMVTHAQAIAEMADRVIRMRSGKIIDTYRNERPVSAEDIEW